MHRRAAPTLLVALAVALAGCKGGKNEIDGMGTFTCQDVKEQTCVGPTDQFAATADIVHVLYKTRDVPTRGDVYHFEWIAEDVGEVVPANTSIAILQQEVEEETASARFYVLTSYFTKPTNGWPPGTYRVEVKHNGELATTARFSIK
jgi:hypothetical protein